MKQSEIIKRVRQYTKTNDNPEASYPEEEVVSDLNAALDEVVMIIEQASTLWEFDDDNYEGFSIADTDLEKGINNYELPYRIFTISRVEVKDDNGNYKKLKPVSEMEIDIPITDIEDGTPDFYSLRGNHLMLLPAPDYTSDQGLSIIYNREPVQFSEGDDDFEPGIPRMAIELLVLNAAKYYSIGNVNAEKRNGLQDEITLKEEKLKAYIADRPEEKQGRVRPGSLNKTQNYQS